MAELLEKDNGSVRSSRQTLTTNFKELLADKDGRIKMGLAANRAANRGTGATAKTLDVINSLIGWS
jgi:hypothetical protein